jgi:hypothetical protein
MSRRSLINVRPMDMNVPILISKYRHIDRKALSLTFTPPPIAYSLLFLKLLCWTNSSYLLKGEFLSPIGWVKVRGPSPAQ